MRWGGEGGLHWYHKAVDVYSNFLQAYVVKICSRHVQLCIFTQSIAHSCRHTAQTPRRKLHSPGSKLTMTEQGRGQCAGTLAPSQPGDQYWRAQIQGSCILVINYHKHWNSGEILLEQDKHSTANFKSCLGSPLLCQCQVTVCAWLGPTRLIYCKCNWCLCQS